MKKLPFWMMRPTKHSRCAHTTSFLFVGVCCLMFCTPAIAQAVGGSAPALGSTVTSLIAPREQLKKLESLIQAAPTVVDEETYQNMVNLAATRRLDVAVALVRCLGLNRNPAGHSTSRTAELVPTIELLGRYYDESVVPLIYAEALEHKESWFRDRAAVAIKSLIKEDKIREMDALFSLDASQDPAILEFVDSLLNSNMEVDLASSPAQQH